MRTPVNEGVARNFRSGHRVRICLSALAALVLTLPQGVSAATLYWSANGTTQGGALTGATAWNTTNAHWGPNGGPWTAVWNNANVDRAVFDTAAGTVNINAGTGTGTAITVNTITTGITGYSIGNGNLAGAGNTIIFSGAGRA